MFDTLGAAWLRHSAFDMQIPLLNSRTVLIRSADSAQQVNRILGSH